jgi:dinuclear metal center YbgI/SA1388 family protein
MNLTDLVAYLNEYLDIRGVPDWKEAHNGLQVEGTRPIRRIVAAVDACIATTEAAVALDADLVIVHHGLFWGGQTSLSGAHYKRIAPLIRNGTALYSCHLPLDVHPEVGNNHVLTRACGLSPNGLFADYEGIQVGVLANTELPRDTFVERVSAALGYRPKVMPFGPEVVRKVGVLTGGGGSWIAKAKAAGCDTYLTGEGAHHTYFDAEEMGLNVIYGGHYATETFGVKALAQHLQERFGIEWAFADHPTGL